MSAFGGKADMTRDAPMSAFDPKQTQRLAVKEAKAFLPQLTLDEILSELMLLM
jgi:hypothetical protein